MRAGPFIAIAFAAFVISYALSALLGCAPVAVGRVGAPVPAHVPQAADQCAAQPDLAWCVEARKHE